MNPDLLHWATSLMFGKGFDRSIALLRILLIGALLDLLIVPILMVFCIQVCPAKTFRGELLITAGFLIAAFAAASGYFSLPVEQAMAWVAVSTRLAKLLLYGSLFLTHTSRTSLAASGATEGADLDRGRSILDQDPGVRKPAACFVSRPAD